MPQLRLEQLQAFDQGDLEPAERTGPEAGLISNFTIKRWALRAACSNFYYYYYYYHTTDGLAWFLQYPVSAGESEYPPPFFDDG